MIAFIKGILVDKSINYITVEVNGMGCEIIISSMAFPRLPDVGDTVFIHTHLQVLENEFRLYGFLDSSELRLFKQLLGVSGMGAKGALNVLGAMEPSAFYQAIAGEDEKTLMKIPGIGKKSAQRLVFELKDKIQDSPVMLKNITDDDTADLVEALEVLGYNRSEVLTLVIQMKNRSQLSDSIEENIKRVLQSLKFDK